MASLLAASCQDLAATYGLHTRTETVRFGAAAFARLKCALWQSNPPMLLRSTTREYYAGVAQAALAAKSELLSVLVHGRRGQERGLLQLPEPSKKIAPSSGQLLV